MFYRDSSPELEIIMVRIIIDSACDLPKTKADELNLDFLPLKTIFGEEEFLDGIDLTREEFYTKLENSSVNPTTSQISPADFEDIYEDVKKNGDTAVVITISSKLSGTYQSANIAREDYEDCIYVVDSLNATVGEQLLVLYACQLRDQGATAAEIVNALEKKKGDICLAAVLDTLEYLQRGGRISKTVAVAGTLLSVKPLIALENGEVASIGNARGIKNASTQFTKALQERGEVDFSMPCAWVYSGHSDELLQNYIAGNADAWAAQIKNIPITGIGSTIGTHVGPNAFGLAFFRK